jgi:murein DD-endopeptidase MepM/ murein hydrolase activator NlpD
MLRHNKVFRLFSLLNMAVMACLIAWPILPASAEGAGTLVPAHFWLDRPIPLNRSPYVASGFSFGWDRRGQSPVHHGVDLVNRRGTPVLAAAAGTFITRVATRNAH